MSEKRRKRKIGGAAKALYESAEAAAAGDTRKAARKDRKVDRKLRAVERIDERARERSRRKEGRYKKKNPTTKVSSTKGKYKNTDVSRQSIMKNW